MKYTCWFVINKQKSKTIFEVDSPKQAAKALVKRDWYKHVKKIENPWDNVYRIGVEDQCGNVSTWSITIEPSFYAKSFVKFR